jgi:hypothetical protein
VKYELLRVDQLTFGANKSTLGPDPAAYRGGEKEVGEEKANSPKKDRLG